MSISLLREHIREMLSLLLSEDASTDGMSVGAADTGGMTGTTGTTGTKGTTGTSKKNDDKSNKPAIPQLASMVKAMGGGVFKSKAEKLGSTSGATFDKAVVGAGDAAEDAVMKALEDKAEKNGTKPKEPNARRVYQLKILGARNGLKQAMDAERESQKLAATGKASSTDKPSDKIKAVSDEAMAVATGQQKPKK